MIWNNFGSVVYAATGGVGGLSTTTLVTNGQWHHYALTKQDGGNWTLYRDGVQMNISTATSTYVQGEAPFTFARHGRTDAGHLWPGTLDDVALWDEVLSPQRVALVAGLGSFAGVSANSNAIDTMLTTFTAGQGSSTTIEGRTWRYAPAAELRVASPAVGASGSVRGSNYILLDSTGNGVLSTAVAPSVAAGAGTSIPLDAVDTPNGPRTNVDRSFTVFLEPGQYRATDFSFAYGQSGAAVPFLAKLVGDNQYEVLAVGDATAVTGSGMPTVAFGGTSLFGLETPTTLFAGFVNPTGSNNPICLDDGTTTITAHAGGMPVSLGAILSGFGGNGALGRTYAFSINVAVAPEPTSLGLALLGGLGMFLALWRRRANV
jgi:hypothetical protein